VFLLSQSLAGTRQPFFDIYTGLTKTAMKIVSVHWFRVSGWGQKQQQRPDSNLAQDSFGNKRKRDGLFRGWKWRMRTRCWRLTRVLYRVRMVCALILAGSRSFQESVFPSWSLGTEGFVN